MRPQPPTNDPRQKWKPCPKCGEHDWFYGSKPFCGTCREQVRNSPEAQQKKAAQLAVKEAIRTGRLVRQPCEACARSGNTQRTKSHGHHEDYSKPLEVIWLCSLHHCWVHGGRRDEVIPTEGKPMPAFCQRKTSHSYYVVMQDFADRGLEAVVHPEDTRRDVVHMLASGESKHVAFIHHVDGLYIEDVTDELFNEAEALCRLQAAE